MPLLVVKIRCVFDNEIGEGRFVNATMVQEGEDGIGEDIICRALDGELSDWKSLHIHLS